jgi:predicted nucleic acid-binding protein
MSVFVDTSAFLAVLDRDDANHARAAKFWRSAVAAGERWITSNYVLVETLALIQHRLGLEAVREFSQDAVPILDIRWIGAKEHESALAMLLSAGRRKLSFVDCTSFELLRSFGIRRVFAFDRHFREQGCDCLP